MIIKSTDPIAPALDDQQHPQESEKEISVVALMMVREVLGWSKKTLLVTAASLSQLLKQINTKEGESLYSVLIQEDGAVKPEYMIWLNNRPVKQEHSLDIPLQSGDRIVVMSVIRFAAGG